MVEKNDSIMDDEKVEEKQPQPTPEPTIEDYRRQEKLLYELVLVLFYHMRATERSTLTKPLRDQITEIQKQLLGPLDQPSIT